MATQSLTEVLSNLIKGGIGGAANAASSVTGGAVPDMKTFSTIATQFNTTLKSVKMESVTDIGKNINALTGTMNKMLNTSVSAILKLADSVVAFALGLQTDLLRKTTMGVTGGMSGAVNAFGSTLKETMNKLAQSTGIKSIGAMGDMMGQVMSTAMSIFSLRFQDSLVIKQARYAAESQMGGAAGGGLAAQKARGDQAAKTMQGLYGDFAREEAAQWGKAMTDQGAILEPKLTEMMVQVGMSMGLDPSKMGGILDQFMVLETTGEKAGKAMSDSFRAAKIAAEQSGIPANRLQENIQKAAVNARYLNVDFKTVASTMQMMTANQEKFKSAGVSIREDGGKILNELSGGTKKWSDSLHVFFGTKGGTEGSAMEGWAKSKFGEQQAASLTRTEGGGFGKMEGDNSGQMMVQRLDVMKSTMMEASKGASTDAEALFIQMKLAQETFGMSEETAKVLAMSGKDELKALADNPKLADEFKTQKQVMSDLKSMASVDQNIQRGMASLAAAQIKYMMATATNTALLAAMEAGLIKKDTGDTKKAAAGSFGMLMDANVDSIKAMKRVAGQTLDSVAPGELDKMIAAMNLLSTAAGMPAPGLFSGGNVRAAAEGLNARGGIKVSERGSELWKNGSESMFLPGADGQIYNASATKSIFEKGLSGGDKPTQVQAGGSGNQTTLNITLNVEATNKENFAKILEQQLLNRIYS